MTPLIFATYNGAATLPLMLDALTRIEPPEGGWRVIAVDNRSDDDSPAILESYRDRLPLDILQEPAPGKNRALNAALAELGSAVDGSDIVVFTDDDILPEPDWLRRLQAAARAHPEAYLFGGAIGPAWMAPPPDWLKAIGHEYGMLYARTSHPGGPCAAGDIWGPNMAVRPHVFSAGYRFSEKVGPDGTETYAMGSETEFLERVERAGFAARFVHEARVGHLVRPFQMERAWILRRARRAGRGARETGGVGDGRRLLFHRPPWLIRGLLLARLRVGWACIRADAAEVLAARIKLNWHLGVGDRLAALRPAGGNAVDGPHVPGARA